MNTDTTSDIPEMIVTGISVYERYAAYFTIENGPVLPVPHSRSGAVMRVDRVHAEWAKTGSGAWRLSLVSATGPKLKKDGSDSAVPGTINYYRREQHPFVALLDAHGPDNSDGAR